MEDHIHILAGFSPTRALADVIREIKANASKWCNETFKLDHRFEWQKGYGAFTVSYSLMESVCLYIQHQAEHHKKTTFKDEYMMFLKLHKIEFDHRYLFEAEHHG